MEACLIPIVRLAILVHLGLIRSQGMDIRSWGGQQQHDEVLITTTMRSLILLLPIEQ